MVSRSGEASADGEEMFLRLVLSRYQITSALLSFWAFEAMEGCEDGQCQGPAKEDSVPGMGSAWWFSIEYCALVKYSGLKLYPQLDVYCRESVGGQVAQDWREKGLHLSACCILGLVVGVHWVLARRVRMKRQTLRNLGMPSSGVEWNVLPTDIPKRVMATLPYERVYQLKAVSKNFRDCIEEDEFLLLQAEYSTEIPSLTACHCYLRGGVLQFAGYDSSLQKWRRLPPLDYLPDYCAPDPDRFKEFLLCSHGGLVCMNVSKSTEEKLIVFNPLIKQWKLLPPLHHRRNPVLMHLLVDADTQSFLVVVAGSSKSGDENLSRITECFDSRSWTWKRTGDLPGPDYALNDFQSGVHRNGHLFCVAFLDQNCGRGLLRYDLNLGIWLKNWTFPFSFAITSTILQLVENRGEVFVFSEQVSGEAVVDHCIDRLEWNCSERDKELGIDSCNLRSVARNKKLGGRSLEIYPEHVCVGFSEHELSVFNAIDHSGVVYDVDGFAEPKTLEAPAGQGLDGGEAFYTLNPLTFPLQPSFKMKLERIHTQ